jgi:N-methylhydantoinase A
MIRIASDIGGTFTDVVLDRDGELTTAKVLSTPAAPEVGLMEGVRSLMAEAGVAPEAVDQFIHGSTLATNALIERRGARTAQIATAGFRDVLEMAHENRFDQYDLSIDRAPPLVARPLRWEIAERIGADGRILRPLDERAATALIASLEAEGIESVAITLLHAYANPAHEQRLAALVREALPGLPVSLSCEVSPEIREFERFTTTCANAYVQPLMARYLTALSQDLSRQGFHCPLFLVTSGGDLTDLATALAYPVRLVESGPAGGAVLAAKIAREAGLDEVLAFDMGGTTAKLCLIDAGKPQSTRTFEVGRVHHNMKGSGFPIRIPAIELVEIGSGGGSIARVDPLGRLLVGPHSAGAVPGPVCYGRGGERPTVTDADLALGRIEPSRFSGGVALDAAAATGAIARDVGGPLSLPADLAAHAIGEIVDETMAGAARVHGVESGKPLATRTMIAFGGAAPLHAARVAAKVGVTRILVPANAGVGSAVGFLAAGLAFEQARSLYMTLEAFDREAVNRALDEMSAQARRLLGGEAHAYAETSVAYMRYRGQGHEITVPSPAPRLGPDGAGSLRAAFEQRYAALFGQIIPDLEIETLTWTLRVERIDPAHSDPARPPALQATAGAVASEPVSLVPVFDAFAGERLSYAVFDRSTLAAGQRVAGPCLIVEAQTTTVAPLGFAVEVAADGALILTRQPQPEVRP